MKTLKDFARQKERIAFEKLVADTGSYNFKEQRRFVGADLRLIIWSTKSSTMFDGESSTNEADS
ncbi:hypothetical protein DESAMIL20_1742 [Desulfurella amilsii]|uniref:Uncharacterized protein n=1 Tax=Desulfurella amilsii TaxID=1562698 RepID=A0A1X4XXC7_9BACT|nr:hypothetical protein [Desulfurella amilsii]OSS42189.1 hypothetical protein DESAMIL20_1742 [Desulfurella amilsii]